MLNLETLVKALNKAKIPFDEGCSTIAKRDIIHYISKSGKSIMMFFDNKNPSKLLQRSSIRYNDTKAFNTIRKSYSENQVVKKIPTVTRTNCQYPKI